MSDNKKMNYYEILEVPVNASFFEIRHAYKEALSVYGEDSLSTYSLFSEGERENLLRKIEEAFHTLVDEKKRSEYNHHLVENGVIDPTELAREEKQKSIPIFLAHNSIDKNMFFKKVKKKVEESGIRELTREIMETALISGQDLKRLRQAIGIKLDDIFEVARISISILKAIENNEFHNLPSLIYLRNFLKSYAEILHLDPEKVADSYIINISLLQK
ncbi:MAG: helix-turn-helix domain-containing protein [Pseudomonadota bacterium]